MDQAGTLAQLAERMRRWQGAAQRRGPAISSGSAALDGLLPHGGLARGTLVEWIADGPSSGAGTLALAAAREACRDGGALVVVDRREAFYAPALTPWKIDLARLLIVHPRCEEDECWALDQALRSPAVAAVLGWPGRWSDVAFRRLQLAAEQGGAVGLLVRGPQARHDPSWAMLRLAVRPLALPPATPRRAASTLPPAVRRRVRVELLRAAGSLAGGSVDLEIDERQGTIQLDHETHPMPVVSPLAAPAARASSAGA
jgi:hypothetical protein